MAKKKPVRRRKKVQPGSVGLSPAETRAARSADLDQLADQVEKDGGVVLGSYRDPFGGSEILIVSLPVERVEPTPFQRDPSDPHVKRLMTVIEKIGRFLDPIIAVRRDEGYWTPNGNHRLQALKRLGVRSVTALLLPDADVAFKILALNTEKAHNLREKALETIRMARELAKLPGGKESDYPFEFEEASYLTLGVCYERRPRFSGGAYHSVLRRIEDFLDVPLAQSLKERESRAEKVLKIDDRVAAIVEQLKQRGLTSPYLKPFVVARINPIRFSKATAFDADEIIERMMAAATRFNVERVKQEDIARAGGAPGEEG
jgi:ParB family chromosome partitioning protein